jgi:hypothetical protein
MGRPLCRLYSGIYFSCITTVPLDHPARLNHYSSIIPQAEIRHHTFEREGGVNYRIVQRDLGLVTYT